MSTREHFDYCAVRIDGRAHVVRIHLGDLLTLCGVAVQRRGDGLPTQAFPLVEIRDEQPFPNDCTICVERWRVLRLESELPTGSPSWGQMRQQFGTCRCVSGRDSGRAPGPNHDVRCPAYVAARAAWDTRENRPLREDPTPIGSPSWEALFNMRKGLDREMAEQIRQALAIISMRLHAIDETLHDGPRRENLHENLRRMLARCDVRLLREDIDECNKAIDRIGAEVRKLDAWSK